MTFEEIHQALAAKLGEKVGPLMPAKKDPFALVQPEALVEACDFLKHDPRTAMDCLMNLSAVDAFKGEGKKLHVVYHLYSYARRHAFILKVALDPKAPIVPSVESVWKSADWLEREQFDLLGVSFTGHPDLRRIMLPDDWVGHPLRKDYKEPLEYHHISHLRENPLEGFVRLDQFKKAAAEKSAADAAAAAGKKELLQ